MTTASRKFEIPVKCKLGWNYPLALVAIRSASETSQDTLLSHDCIVDYVESVDSHAISYTANFWGGIQDQMDGLESRPLFDKVWVDAETIEGKGHYEHNEIFTVDLESVGSLQIIQDTNLSKIEKRLKLIQADLTRKFKR